MKKLISRAAIGITLIGLLGCSSDEKKEKVNVLVDARGEWQGEHVYANDFFGFAIDIDEKWHIQKSIGEEFSGRFAVLSG